MRDGALSLHIETAEQAPSVTDDDLVAAARTDSRAFGPLYDRYVDAVFRYHYRQTGTVEAAQDLTSLTFTRALAGLQRFQANRPFAPWLFRIAHNALVDHRRSRARTVRMTAEMESALNDRADDQAFGAAVDAGDFLQLTAGLPDDQRDALALRFTADLSTAQVAAALGRRPGATRMLLARGIATLRARAARNTRGDQQ